MSIGTKIRQLRHDKHIKQEDLAQYLSMTQGTLSKIENNNLSVTANDLLKIAAYTNTPIMKLLPDSVQTDVQHNHEHTNGVFINYAQKDQASQKRITELEDLVIDLKNRNLELQEKVKRRDIKIEHLKMKYVVES